MYTVNAIFQERLEIYIEVVNLAISSFTIKTSFLMYQNNFCVILKQFFNYIMFSFMLNRLKLFSHSFNLLEYKHM